MPRAPSSAARPYYVIGPQTDQSLSPHRPAGRSDVAPAGSGASQVARSHP
ncbi:MAG: hypothetical protein ACYSXF_08775 [Planctomycetota bacterium]